MQIFLSEYNYIIILRCVVQNLCVAKNCLSPGRHMHPKILKGLSLGLSFQFFEYLSFEFEFEYFANLKKDNLR